MSGLPRGLEDIRRLVDRALRGDQRAMLHIVDRYKLQVFRMCYRMLGQRQDAEDMAQESFVRVLGNLNRWDRRREFEPWLFTIVANRCRSQLTRRRRQPVTEPLVVPPSDDRWGREHAATHTAEEVHLALQHLRCEHRQAFLMFHQEGLSLADIAESQGVPLGTVKSWLHRARRDLIQRLQDRGVVPEPRHAVR
jgi:RNA polymerase sigma-70 factor (ECF subfamily)